MQTSGFDPKIHGYRFGNRFTTRPIPFISSLEFPGLCGGMSFSALDYYYAGLPIPPHQPEDFPDSRGAPPSGSRLESFIRSRQVDSVNPLVTPSARKYFTWAPVSRETARGYTETDGIQSACQLIDSGRPASLGLVNDSLMPTNSHQVVAYAFEVDSEQQATNFWIYENNRPGETIRLSVSFHEPLVHEQILDSSTGQYAAYRTWKGFFVQDYRSKHPSFMASVSEVWSDDWSPGWTSFMPFTHENLVHWLAYNSDQGKARIDRLRPGGRGVDNVWKNDAQLWSKGWSSFVPVRISGTPYCLSYRINDGLASIDRFHNGLQGLQTVWQGSWSGGWSTLIPFETTDGQQLLFAYRASDGAVAIDQIRDPLQGAENLWKGFRAPGFTEIAPFAINGQLIYLAYNPTTGQTRLEQTQPDLQGVETLWGKSWPTNWASFTSFIMNGEWRILSRHAGSRRIAVDRLLPNRENVEPVWDRLDDYDWSLFAALPVSHDSGLDIPHHLACKRHSGEIRIARLS